MHIKPYFSTLGIFLAVGLLLPTIAFSKNTSKPNLLLIIVDDVGYGQFSCYPHVQPVRTPHIDALARSGVRMTQGYSADPMCAPSRQSIRSGCYRQRLDTEASAAKDRIARHLASDGYATACIGKSQLPGNPLEHGYDEFYGFMAGIHDYDEVRMNPDEYNRLKKLGHPRSLADIPDRDKSLDELLSRLDLTFKNWEESLPYQAQRYSPIFHNTQPVDKFEHLTIEFTSRTIDFVERHRDKPWFVYLSYNTVHHPHEAPEKYMRARNAEPDTAEAQLAQLDCLDDEIGRLLERLEQLGQRDNTLIMLMGDNGGLSFKGANMNLRGHKSQFHEGGIRVPFIASWPAGLPANVVYDHPVMHIDLVPTLLGGGGISTNVPLDGVNLLPYWRGEREDSPHDALFWSRDVRHAVRRGDWKLLKRGTPPNNIELYNLALDPGETKNLARLEEQRVADLQDLLMQWHKR